VTEVTNIYNYELKLWVSGLTVRLRKLPKESLKKLAAIVKEGTSEGDIFYNGQRRFVLSIKLDDKRVNLEQLSDDIRSQLATAIMGASDTGKVVEKSGE